MIANPNIRRILVPYDFSEGSENALRYALVLGQTLGARLTIVHVCDIAPYGYANAYFGSFEDFAREVEAGAREAMRALGARLRDSGTNVETAVRRGEVWREVEALVIEGGADLIIMGTQGRKGVSRLLLGSVAERVVRTAPCPVLTVHAPSEGEETRTRTQPAQPAVS